MTDPNTAHQSELNALALAQQLRPLLTRAELLYSRRSEESQLSRAQLSIMMTLHEIGPCRINQLAEAEAIRMPTASNAVHHLEDAGMVERVRDTKDRRGVRVELTEKGRTELARVTKERDEQMAAMFASLNPEQLALGEQLVPVMRTILENYGKVVEQEINGK
ncbi:MarR family transcriptional regulator [Corynebacterium sp. TAE3-ERU12]|uniref:MarR family winged helix-turn-helix transcriptional regulator n=1 Tax=Corynebacterium sp. TAE3-ERU12 TaxID=2849491 RepID=UPI001C44D4A8|nr:MarR family transcriptional regulator [Corynebacterium sp. TAE3-ERU12]MBV7294322.1 MarR family transcriptional regulator [Corynebacterium sp. TAE3-ERU12]